MRKIIIALVVLVVLLVAAIGIVPQLIPSSVYKDKIQSQLSSELGRDVTISGDVKLAVFPTIKARTDRVEIANPATSSGGFDSDVFASMDGLDAQVKLWPLFSKRVEIKSFTLKNPAINLNKNAAGEPNWVLGAESSAPEPNDTPAGPFKRDGRYSTIDPAIGLFSIENGNISYVDATKPGTDYRLTDVNLGFALPSMAKPVKIDGDFKFNGDPIDLSLQLDSPRKFLNGDAAPLDLDVTAPFADVSAKGQFTPGQAVAFKLSVDADVTDVASLAQRLPMDVPYVELAKTVTLSGNYSYDGKTLTATGANIKAAGEMFEAAFSGGGALTNPPRLDGNLSANVNNIPALANALNVDMKGLELVRTAKITTALASKGTGLSANDIDVSIGGNGVNAAFKGTGEYSDKVTANGSFTANAVSVANLVKALEMDVPAAAALGDVSVKGNLALAGKETMIRGLDVTSQNGVATGTFRGNIALTDRLVVDGNFDTALSSLSDFQAASSMAVPYAGSINKVSASGNVSGQDKAFKISNLQAMLSDGQINGKFTGQANTNDGFTLDGNLAADIPSLRAVAAEAGVQLPPSTDKGPIFERFSVAGDISGTPSDMTFKNAAVSMDHLKGKGDFTVDMKPEKPFVNGTLQMEGLDLRPYMASYAAQNPTGEIQPWSETPIAVSPLKAVNGDFKLSTPNIKTDRITLGQSDINAELRDGILRADFPNVALYGGAGSMTGVVNAQGAVPIVEFNAKLNNLTSDSFLGAVAGFTNASGKAGTGVTFKGQGQSIAAIMKSLDGDGNFEVVDGKIAGIDLAEFMTGLDAAFTSRTLPSGIGSNYVTQFKDIIGLFTIEDGVAKVGKFSLDGAGILAEGQGQIDLGNQAIDFSLRPRLTGESASDLASFGIPIRITGDFGSAKVGLDTDLLGRIVAERAKAKARSEITDAINENVGGGVGNVLGGILGGETKAPTTPPKTETGQETPAPEPASEEDVVKDVLGGLLGRKPPNEPAETESETTEPINPGTETAEPEKAEEKTDEEAVEDALKSLFGRKKKEPEPAPEP